MTQQVWLADLKAATAFVARAVDERQDAREPRGISKVAPPQALLVEMRNIAANSSLLARFPDGVLEDAPQCH